ncbi:hypothetical protein K458DRAFT_291865, partial [Lentithecium fluviatile CBS 122367]
LTSVIQQALSIHRFPAFCAALVGGSTLLQLPIRRLLVAVTHRATSTVDPLPLRAADVLAKLFAALISASVSFNLINSGSSSSPPGPFDEPPETDSRQVNDATLGALSLSRADLAGKTLDLTLFAVVRALDVVVSSIWHRMPAKSTSRLGRIPQTVPTLLFCFSAATIMHAWFYTPSRLPRTYNNWISLAADLDHRLLLVLRHARYGTWVYGKDTGMGPLLGSLCHDYGLPEELGDPAVTIPVPCELVHMGCGKNCEKHALVRFWRGWLFAAKMYAPLQLIVLARHVKKNARPGNRFAGLTQAAILKALEGSARSSAFLGAFVAFFYYGVCLSRTRVGPKLFSYKTVTPQMWDSGLCVLGGCLLCGTSILFEQSRRRLEVLFFVLPRAAATWFPRRYLPEQQWKERLAFTLSAAVLITTAQENPSRVRGVFGKVLHGVLKTN